jgi:hypothetical protein
VTTSEGAAAGLAQCASGAFNSHWTALGHNLVTNELADTVVRPGWEMNGNWFDWSAGGRETDYIGCFRQIVTTMRAVPGQKFTFNWNVSLGPANSSADAAYPGDAYVDQVGVDLYDWIFQGGVYDTKAAQSPEQRTQAIRAAWQTKLNGDHGLTYWSKFAAAHGKALTIPEWGLADRSKDEYGGGDNPYFIQQMFNFIYNPANHVEFAAYFNTKSPDGEHRVQGSDAFPKSAALFRQLVQHPPGGGSTRPAAAVLPGSSTLDGGSSPAPTQPPDDPVAVLRIGTGPDREDAQALNDQTVADQLYAWVDAPTGTTKVEFRIDDPQAALPPVHVENDGPFDLGGTEGAQIAPYSVADLSAGQHTLTATVFLPGRTLTVSSRFEITH